MIYIVIISLIVAIVVALFKVNRNNKVKSKGYQGGNTIIKPNDKIK